jgi:hypothetical protein
VALSIVTYSIDKKHETHYYDRFIDFLKHMQTNDLTGNASVTDVKGDRSLGPHEQEDKEIRIKRASLYEGRRPIKRGRSAPMRSLFSPPGPYGREMRITQWPLQFPPIPRDSFTSWGEVPWIPGNWKGWIAVIFATANTAQPSYSTMSLCPGNECSCAERWNSPVRSWAVSRHFIANPMVVVKQARSMP